MDAEQLGFDEDEEMRSLFEEESPPDDKLEEFGFISDVPQSVLDAYVPEEFPPIAKLEYFSEETFGIVRRMSADEMDLFLENVRKQRQEEQKELSYQKEIPALFYLVRELKLTKKEEMLTQALNLVRKGRGYRTVMVIKKDGKEREINIPVDVLKKVQRKINRHILTGFLRTKNSFGFSGGNIVDAITPHLRAKCILCIDIKDAFPSVKFDDVFDYLTEGRTIAVSGYRYYSYDRVYYDKVHDKGHFSWYAARIIADLITFKDRLPQGAPTSPRMFDLICKDMDGALSKLADKVGGTYTRYADNIFFSINKKLFPGPLRQAILKIIENRQFSPFPKRKHRHPGPYFDWHELKVKEINERSPVRLLGLNIIEGKIHNTRPFKRQLRLSVHHLNWLLDHGMDNTPGLESAWTKLQGQMNFARTDTLPKKLVEEYLRLKEKLQ